MLAHVADTTRMVPAGVREDGSGFWRVPAGLDLADFDVVDVSVEPFDGSEAHSGTSDPCGAPSVTVNWSVYATGTGWSVKYTASGSYTSNRPVSDHTEFYTYYPSGACRSYDATFRAVSTGWPTVYDTVRTTYSLSPQ